MADEQHRVPLAALRQSMDPDALGFETTAEVAPITGTVGQDRAMRALEFGLQVNTTGHHVYAAGPEGTGKMTAITTLLAHIKTNRTTPADWCYLHNFENADEPLAIRLPAGRGERLEKEMQHFLESAKETLPRAFLSDDYAHRKAEVLRTFEDKRKEISQQVEDEARRESFAMEATPVGIATIPLVEGKPLTQEEFNNLPQEEQQALQEKGDHLKAQLEEAARRGRALEQEGQAQVERLNREVACAAVEPLLNVVRDAFADLPAVLGYLDRVHNDIPEHLTDFLRTEAEGRDGLVEAMLHEDNLAHYRVNLFVDNSDTQGAPVVVEYQPTFYNLFGRVDYRPRLGSMVTNATMIKPGAIHRANGGYLVVQARDLLTSPFAWETLKHTLRSGVSRIENLGEQFTAVPTTTLRPQEIPIDVKIVLVGPAFVYHLLHGIDDDFRQLFGVRADFTIDMDRTPTHIAHYAGFISSLAQREHLKPFHKGAVAQIIDFTCRAAGDQHRLSTRFHEAARLAREAHFWASQNGNGAVTAKDVQRAFAEREYRNSLPEDTFRRLVLEDTIHIATAGAVVAQVNGLSVIDAADYAFGHPSRITARTYLGMQGVVNIEREIALSGRIHSKGILLLAGFLAGRYAQDKPLALSASLTFEQTYDEIDGDSASSAELYALLSCLAGLPIKQGIAVTGSVNQFGDVQAIGGVNEKIEGFFRICRQRGLTGEQGVLIPQDNVKHLMLREDVVQAVREGMFHLWAVQSVDEGIELLTGIKAGDRRANGSYPPGTVNYLVDRQLRTYAQRLRQFRPPATNGYTAHPQALEGRAARRRARRQE